MFILFTDLKPQNILLTYNKPSPMPQDIQLKIGMNISTTHITQYSSSCCQVIVMY